MSPVVRRVLVGSAIVVAIVLVEKVGISVLLEPSPTEFAGGPAALQKEMATLRKPTSP